MSGYWTEAVEVDTGETLPVYIEELPPIYIGSPVKLCAGLGGASGVAEEFSPDGWKIKVRHSRRHAAWYWSTEVQAV